MQLTPDPTFYPSPAMATQAPPETLGYVALVNPREGGADALGVVDLDPASKGYGRLIGQTDMPHAGDELHHFGWNACSSCLCPYAPHPHMERRYLVVPGIHSSRIHVLDTKPDPRRPRIVKVIEAETIARRTGYAAPHTVHCGPDGILLSALGAPDGNGPGGTFLLDAETFEVRGRWELDRGPQELAYDVWWHLGLDTMVTSTWGTPNMVKNGIDPELLLAGKYGSKLHVWDMRRRRHVQELDLGAEQQMVLELRPAHNPTRAYGFAGVVVSLKDLSSSVWLWYRDTTEKPGRLGDQEGDRNPGTTHGSGEAAAAAPGIQGSASAGHRHRAVGRRSLSVRLVLGPRRVHPVRRDGSVQPEEGGLPRARRHGQSNSAPGRPGQAGQRRTADGRSQPRRPADLFHEQPLHAVGQTDLSRRN